MRLESFLTALQNDGSVVLDDALAPSQREVHDAAPVLREMDRLAKTGFPGTPPALSMPAACWAAVLLYRSCQFLVHRAVSADDVVEALRTPCPGTPTASVVYSVDLTLRYLPDLVSLARGLAPDDPLVEELGFLSREWPFSSVGMRGVGTVFVDAFWEDACLRQEYVDRILAKRDVSRLDNGPVRAWVRGSLGLYAELCPPVAAAIGEEPTP